jgi:hypothetical protein
MSPDYRPWTSKHRLLGLPLSFRCIESVDIAWGAALGDDTHEPGPWFCDLNASIGRSPFGSTLGAFLTTSRVYDFEREQLILAPEALLLHGMPALSCSFPPSLSSHALFHMVGESMHAPCIGSLLVAIFLNPLAPWWGKP